MKKSVLIIVPTMGCGGQERVAVKTAEILSDNYDVIFAVFDGRGAVFTPSCDVVDFAVPAANCVISKIKNTIRRAYALRKLKDDMRIDITLSFGMTANISNVLSGRRGKNIITLRAFDSISDGLLRRFVFRSSDVIICCAKVMCNELDRIDHVYGDKAVCVYNPYDTELMRNQGSEAVTDYVFSHNTIVAHGRLEEVKNYPRLIKAFYLIRQEVPDARLLIIGEGAERPKLAALISLYSLNDSVTLIGFRNNPFPYISRSSLYVLSSYSEGFPNALVEGMTFLPVVAVDCKTGPREILSNGPFDRVCKGWEEVEFGILVQPAHEQIFSDRLTEDDRLLADAMLSVLSDHSRAKDLQRKANSRAEVFSYDAYRENLMNIFEGRSFMTIKEK